MRTILVSVLLMVGLQVLGQSNDPCFPNHPSDTSIITQCYDNALYYFNHQDYLKAASYFHETEKVIPNCTEIIENLATCYWEYYQNCSTYDLKYMIRAKKYLELGMLDRFVNQTDKSQYQNCLNELNSVLDKKLVSRYYNDGRYYGEMKGNSRDGFGVFYYDNGMRYEGLWDNDKKADWEGELYDSKNNLLFKGVFLNNEKRNDLNTNYREEIEYWKSIEDSNNATVYREYLRKYGETGLYKDEANKRIEILQSPAEPTNDVSLTSTITNTNQFISSFEALTRKDKFERSFIDVTYSLSGDLSIRTGSMYKSRWGFYHSFGINGNVQHIIKEKIDGINRIRFSLGGLYAPTSWMYVYGGAGVLVDSLKSNDNFKSAAELGLMFKLGSLSLSTGFLVNGITRSPSFDMNFGVGFNLHSYRISHVPFTYYIYSPTAPFGVMCAWYKNSFAGYFKIQTPVYIDKIHNLIDPEYKDKPVRYSFTAGMTTSLSSWLGFYAGLGMGMYKDKLDGQIKNKGLDTEIGVSIRISDAFSLSAGLHGVNMTNKDRFLTYDIGIGTSTWRAFLKRANHTIWEYSFSETANVGIMNGFIYDWYGYYNRIQLTNPFQENKQHNNSDKWQGSRYSLTWGPMLALTDWLFVHGGIGMGLYRKDNYEKTTDLGFETELGVSLRAWLFDVSFGPHWCRVGKDDAFLDYNLGVGVNLPLWLGNSHFGNHGAMFGRLRYSGYTRFGMDMGIVWDPVGFYVGFLEALPELRLNFSAGAVFTPSALMHYSLGAGFGIYSNGPDPALGFDLEAMFSFVIWKFPVTIGVKLCRLGSPYMFVEPIYGLGGFQLD